MSNSYGVFEFAQNGGRENVAGKLRWPHQLTVRIPRDRVADVVISLVQSLHRGENADFVLVGELTRDHEQDNGLEIQRK